MLTVLHRAAQLVGVMPPGEGYRLGAGMAAPGIVTDGAVIIRDGIIEWVGPTAEMPAVCSWSAPQKLVQVV